MEKNSSINVLKRENRLIKEKNEVLQKINYNLKHNLPRFTIPNKISILEQTYKVRWKKSLNHDGHSCAGLIDHDKQIIYFKKGMYNDPLQALFHEVGHIVNREFEYSKDEEEFSRIFSLYNTSLFNQLFGKVKVRKK